MNVKEQFLGNKISVFTNDIHTFGTDAVLLADFAKPRKNSKIAEFGTGCGIISLIWCRDGFGKQIDAIDIQIDACRLVNMAVEKYNLHNRLFVHNDDLKNINKVLQIGSYDLVVMNPPYKSASDGIKCGDERIAIARHEIKCNTDDITKSASLLLNTGGRLCMCQRPSRLCDLISSMKLNGIEPKKLRFVQQRYNLKPSLFLIEGKKGAKSGLDVEKPLIIENFDGDFSDEIKQIYGEYYEQKGRGAKQIDG